MIKTLICPKCQKDVEVALSESGPHVKASCFICGGYIKFLNQTELKGEQIMSDMEITVPIEGSEYGELVVINKYGDQYSLVLGGKTKDGKVYMKWCYPQDKDKNARDKAVPWKINLGDSTSARKTVEGIAMAFGIIGNSPTLPEERGGIPKQDITPDDDIPF